MATSLCERAVPDIDGHASRIRIASRAFHGNGGDVPRRHAGCAESSRRDRQHARTTTQVGDRPANDYGCPFQRVDQKS
jgi:hypothetical protein